MQSVSSWMNWPNSSRTPSMIPDLSQRPLHRRRSSFLVADREMCDSVVRFRTSASDSGNMIGKDFLVGRLIVVAPHSA